MEGLKRKLKLQYFGHLMQRADSLKNTLKLGKTEGKRGRQWQRMRWLDSITDSIWANSRRQWMMGSLICCSPWSCIESNTTYETEQKQQYEKQKLTPQKRRKDGRNRDYIWEKYLLKNKNYNEYLQRVEITRQCIHEIIRSFNLGGKLGGI